MSINIKQLENVFSKILPNLKSIPEVLNNITISNDRKQDIKSLKNDIVVFEEYIKIIINDLNGTAIKYIDNIDEEKIDLENILDDVIEITSKIDSALFDIENTVSYIKKEINKLR